MFFARKITRAKWVATEDLSDGEIPADAVTVDLRTQQNSLSFWRCPTDEYRDIEKAALAIAAAGDRVDKLDVVWIPDEELQADGQVLEDSAGRTPVTDMAAMHVDVSRLDYVRLGNVARGIAAAIEANRWRRLTRRRVKALIEDAVDQGRVDPASLGKSLRAEVAN